MAKKKTVQKRNKPLPGVNPDRPFPPKPRSKKKKKNSSTRKIRGTTLAKTFMADEFSLLPLENERDGYGYGLFKDTKIKKNIFIRFKDWLGNAWFVFFNSYGG